MAGKKFTVEVQIAALTTIQTVLMVTASAIDPVFIRSIGVSFNGISGTGVPIDVIIARFTTAGTPGSAPVPRKMDEDVAGVIQASAGAAFSLEPTIGDILMSWFVHPQTGLVVPFYFLEEIKIKVSNRCGIKLRTAPGASVGGNFYISCEE